LLLFNTGLVEKELIVNSTPTEVEIGLMEDRQLVELHNQKTDTNFTVGDIFLGKIKRLMPGLNAAFVDIGHKKDAFLHYTDLGPKLNSLIKFTNIAVNSGNNSRLDNFQIEPDIQKGGKIDKVLKRRQYIKSLKNPSPPRDPD